MCCVLCICAVTGSVYTGYHVLCVVTTDQLCRWRASHVTPDILPRGLINQANWCYMHAVSYPPPPHTHTEGYTISSMTYLCMYLCKAGSQYNAV